MQTISKPRVTRRQRRMFAVGGLVVGLGLAAWLGFTAFSKNLMYFYTPVEDRLRLASISLICAGAIGNLIDRAIYGHVIDYVLFHTPVWSFAVFNLADAFITVGAGLVLLDEFLGWRREKAVRASKD